MKLKRITTYTMFLLSAIAINAEIKKMIPVYEIQQEIQDVKHVQIDSRFCKLTIKQTNGKSIFKGKLEAMVQQDGYNFKIDNDGTSRKISVNVPEDGNTSFAGEIEVLLNPETQLDVESSSGYVTIDSINGCNISIKSTQGKITVSKYSGTLNAETKNGTITITDFDGNLSTATSRGDIAVTNISGDANIETSDGNITISNINGNVKSASVAGWQTYQQINGNLTIKGSSGSLKISNMTGNLTIKTLTSPVNLFEVKGKFNIETTRGPIIGTKGITLTESSNFTTTEGKIQLTFTNGKDDLSFDLQSESSKAAIIARGNTKKKKLSFGKGSIMVTGRTRTGGQVYK